MTDAWRGKRVLVTGACGTVGNELIGQLRKTDAATILGLDNNESGIFFADQDNRDDDRCRFFLGDVRDRDTLYERMRDVDIVLHAAAFKHVRLCEESPADAVGTNIRGVQNVIAAAVHNRVERVLFTSSDKAVNPTNVMGTSKLMGERLITAANAYRSDGGPVFASSRFGNVVGSRGSVIPVFRNQIKKGGPVTLTDPSMTRFIMTMHEAAHLVMESVFLARGGEAFVTKMPVVRIADLAQVMVEELAPAFGHDPDKVEVTTIGALPGEKMYEELLNEEEVRRTVELERYYVVLPAFKAGFAHIEYDYPNSRGACGGQPYNSAREAPLSRDELRTFLREGGLLEAED